MNDMITNPVYSWHPANIFYTDNMTETQVIDNNTSQAQVDVDPMISFLFITIIVGVGLWIIFRNMRP